jgi:hypothetical protein
MNEGKKVSRGPEPERVKIEGDWRAAAAKALKKPPHKDNWPKPKKK